jgi:hypothetical protein
MNDIWEDIISLTVIVLALAAYLVLLNTIFTNQIMQDAAAEKYRRTQGTADLLSAEWSHGADIGVLDPAKICATCPQNTSVSVYDMRKKQKICECGSGANGTVAKLPAAIRYDKSDVAPALIEVRLT